MTVDYHIGWRANCKHLERRCVMSLLLILIILLVLMGGGGLYLGGPRAGISLGGLILIIIVIMAVTGRL
jgi:hypothetical protein